MSLKCFFSSINFFAFILIVMTTSVLASTSPLGTLFLPLQNLDLANIYAFNHSWIDFFIFLCLFVSVTKLTLGRRFEGREGRILSGVIGLILALALTLMEMRMDFSLRSFGPIAAGILIFLFGLVIFYLIKSVNAGYSAAGSISFIVTYFLIRATVPNFFLWIEENQWAAWVHLGLVIALIISFWKVVSSFWSRGSIQSWGRSLEWSRDLGLGQRENTGREKNDWSLIKTRLKRITKGGIKGGKGIVEDLKEMVKIIDEYGDTDRARLLISEKIRDIASRENLLMSQLGSLRQASERVESFDLKGFKDLKARRDKVPDKEKSIVKEEILIEKDKILSEEKLREMESEVMRYDKDFRYSLNMAVECLRSNQPNQAREWISKAIRAEEEAVNILKEMKSLEDRLLKLTKMEFRTLRKEGKEER